MTRVGSRRSVDADFWRGRLDAARAYREAAEDAVTLAEPGDNANPAISQIVLAAIAYGDCLTARRAGVVNQQDHTAASKLLGDVMGAALPIAQETRHRRILNNKDESQYGARRGSLDLPLYLIWCTMIHAAEAESRVLRATRIRPAVTTCAELAQRVAKGRKAGNRRRYPVGSVWLALPLVRHLRGDLWEVRTSLGNRIARVIFAVENETMYLLHGFIKTTRKTPPDDLRLAAKRWKRMKA